jgi:hypothetical protein
MRSLRIVPLLMLAAALSACSGGSAQKQQRPGRGDQSPIRVPEDEDKDKVSEQQIPPPAYPRDSDLIEFKLRNPTTNRFYVDARSVSVAKDRIVRLTVVIRTPTNETNVRFAGVNCDERQWKDYAFAGNDHQWAVDETAQWRPIQDLRYNNYQYTLYEDFLCIGGVLSSHPAGEADKLVRLLRDPPKPDARVPNRSD